jgi:methylamine dehydrogenase heavy chain
MSNRFRSLILLVAAIMLAAAPKALAQLPPDQMTSLTLPAVGPNWIFVLDAGFPSNVAARVYIVDTARLKMIGQVSGGYLSNFVLAPDHHEFYSVDTYYSRGWRGTRTDVVSIFDAKTLNFSGEVELPPKRLLIVPKRDSSAITPDGQFILVANMTPATSISVVDAKARKFVGEIETPGCVQAFPSGNRQFDSMCADGSLLTVQLDDSGKEKGKTTSKPFFDPSKDPVFDQPALVGTKAYFDSYYGNLYQVDLSGTEAKADAPWSLITAADKAGKWRPGGWQTVAVEPKSGVLLVLMHQGGDWTHKQFGSEVWVFDLAKKQRVKRIKLKTPGYSIFATNADKPMLEVLDLQTSMQEGTGQLEAYNLTDGKFIGKLDQIGSPFVIYGP